MSFRGPITKRPLIIATVAFALFSGLGFSLLSVASPLVRDLFHRIGIHHRPSYQGRDITQWLELLKTNSPPATNALQILCFQRVEHSIACKIELALSYDLLNKYALTDPRKAKFSIIFNGKALIAPAYRSQSGRCMLEFYADDIKDGTNYAKAVLMIADPFNTDHPLIGEGPTRILR